MVPPPKVSPVTGNPVPPHYLHASSVHFQDTQGRSVLLRGVNLSGSAKNPVKTPSWSQKDFWEDAEAATTDWNNSTLNLDDGSADVSDASHGTAVVRHCLLLDSPRAVARLGFQHAAVLFHLGSARAHAVSSS